MSLSAFFAQREQRVGKQVIVNGKVLYAMTCPPPEQPTSECTAAAYFTDDATNDLNLVNNSSTRNVTVK